jgi:dephospho-CoA kinase
VEDYREVTLMKGRIILGLTGMPGAGKGIVREIFQKMGYVVVVMGDAVREESKRRNLEPTPENLGIIMLELRKDEGPAAIAKRCIPKMEKIKDRIVVEGIRSLYEVDEFKKHFPNFTLIAIHASPETRFQRLFKRNRSDDPKEWETFMERDFRELGVGIGAAIATSDHMITNEGSKVQLQKKTRKVLKEISRKWTN